MPKKREINEYSTDPAAQQMLIRAEELGIGTAFTRADNMVPCNIGAAGMCCKQCGMGPCRLTKSGDVGVCGATLDTIQARNLTRAIAAGAAAHSDHGRDMAFLLKATANGEAEGYSIRDVAKLRMVASKYDIKSKDALPKRSPMIWLIFILPNSDSNAARRSQPGAHRRNDSRSGASKTSRRAAWIVKWSRRCIAPISAMTRTREHILEPRHSHGVWRMAGAAR